MALRTYGRGGTACNGFGRACVCDTRKRGATHGDAINAATDKNGSHSDVVGSFRNKLRHFKNKVCHFMHTLYDFMEEVLVFLVGVWRFI